METFLREPSRLAAEQRRIEADMVAASVAHYPVFIQSATKCSEALREVERDSQVAERLRVEEGALRRRLHELSQRGEEWKRGRQQLLVLRSSQEKLRELFEMPSLLESCLRNELYHEANLLHDKVEQLLAAAPDLPALRLIGDEVEETMRKHLPSIIAKLSTPLTPAQCLKVMRFLNRLHIMGDREQRKLFLSRRLLYLRSLLSAEQQRSAFAYLNRVCNVMGTNLQGVINEYHATFDEKGYRTLSAYDDARDTPACDVLGVWIVGVVDDYISILQKNLPLVTGGGELRALLEQAMQTGARLAKHGVDLRPILAGMFHTRAADLWGDGVGAAYAAFSLSLGNHHWAQRHSQHQAVLRQDAAPRAAAADPSPAAPPHVLHQFLPLAYLCNGVLNTLNEIRRCAIVAASPAAVARLTEALTRAVADVVDVAAGAGLDEQETVSYAAFCKVMADDLIPYLARCMATAFDLPEGMGVPVYTLTRPLADAYRPHLIRAAAPPPGGDGAASPRAARRGALRAVFDRIDSDGSGAISRSELLAALRGDAEAQRLLRVRGGGPDQPTGYWAELLFQRLDADKDGSISWAELEPWLEQHAAALDDPPA